MSLLNNDDDVNNEDTPQSITRPVGNKRAKRDMHDSALEVKLLEQLSRSNTLLESFLERRISDAAADAEFRARQEIQKQRAYELTVFAIDPHSQESQLFFAEERQRILAARQQNSGLCLQSSHINVPSLESLTANAAAETSAARNLAAFRARQPIQVPDTHNPSDFTSKQDCTVLLCDKGIGWVENIVDDTNSMNMDVY
jgi:hypothetical protein